MTTASADVAMKGLAFLLEALAKLRAEDTSIHLVVIGKPKYDSKATQLIKELELAECIEFVSGVTDQRIVELYNEAESPLSPPFTRASRSLRSKQCRVGSHSWQRQVERYLKSLARMASQRYKYRQAIAML